MSRVIERKRRHRAAHLGDFEGDEITWRVKVVADCIVVRQKGNPELEFTQTIPEYLAEKVGFTGKTQPLGGVLNERD